MAAVFWRSAQVLGGGHDGFAGGCVTRAAAGSRVVPAVGEMTQQYLAGELSELLGELQDLDVDQRWVRDLGCLRREAETCPLTALRSVTVRALALTDGLCWESLDRADVVAFARGAAVCAELHEFGLCAGLLEGDQGQVQVRDARA
jgi:hypothetical protein